MTLLIAVAILVTHAKSVRADDDVPPDVVMLSSGGQLEGKATETKEGNRTIISVQLANGSTVKLGKDQVKSIRRPKEAYVEYLDKKSKMADTIDAHWEMSEWCKNNLDSKLSNGPSEPGPERRFHLQAILKLDPDHEKARSFLGYQKEKGVWINVEQKRLGHGFVRYNRRWLTPAEVALEQADESWKEQQANWARRLKKLRSTNGREAEVLAELKQIRDPAAVSAVIEILTGEKAEEWQLVLVDVLGNIDATAAWRALCDVTITHPNPRTREHALVLLKQQRIDQRSASQYLANKYLSAKENELINRAGFVLGEIGDRSTVSPLMDALVTEHIVNNPLARNPNSITPSFSSDGGIGMQQGSAQPKLLKLTKKNEAVLDALRQLTKADYGFDENRWKDWYAEQYTLIDLDVRRDD